ncbi:YdbC family protein [Bacillus spongiae]|uniref:YdbC family protein n=1 Tax=Bacillus spongiae TaxID=2683610 RepID=A0ABU8HBE1_9BACI
MLIKWIKCTVLEKNKTAFAKAQEGWENVKYAEGFLGQFGGWDRKNPLEAGILAFWRDSASYQYFMDHLHDELFAGSNQEVTYSTISVSTFEKLSNLTSTDLTKLFHTGEVIRVADCLVESGEQTNFEKAQHDVWNKGMEEASGMLAGVFCHSSSNSEAYLVASIWKDHQSHDDYVAKSLPLLKKQSHVKRTTKQVTGNIIDINPRWTIIPANREKPFSS